MRKTFDIATGYSADNMDEAKWLRRIIFLESVAGVPGMVGLFCLCPAGAVGGCGVPPPPSGGCSGGGEGVRHVPRWHLVFGMCSLVFGMCSLSADNVDDNHVDKAEGLLRGTVITAVRCGRARHGLSTPGEWGGGGCRTLGAVVFAIQCQT
jgi:hypothetical protein